MNNHDNPHDNPRTNPHNNPTAHAADHRMNQLLDQARRRTWTGPDHSPRVEERLKGITMNTQPKLPRSRSALILLSVGVVAAGSLAAAVTHNIMGRRATLITDDGTQYDVELLENGQGASGTFIADDGTVFDIEMVDGEGQKNLTVDINSPAGGTSTVILDGAAPRVTTLPGQTARIEISSQPDDQSQAADGNTAADSKTDEAATDKDATDKDDAPDE